MGKGFRWTTRPGRPASAPCLTGTRVTGLGGAGGRPIGIRAAIAAEAARVGWTCPVRPMRRSISAPTIAGCWWRAPTARRLPRRRCLLPHHPAGRGDHRPRAGSAMPAIERAVEALRDLPRQDAQPRRHAGAADRDRSLPRGGQRRRFSGPRARRGRHRRSRSSTARPKRGSPPPAARRWSIRRRRASILFDIGGGSSELVRLGPLQADAGTARRTRRSRLDLDSDRRRDACGAPRRR